MIADKIYIYIFFSRTFNLVNHVWLLYQRWYWASHTIRKTFSRWKKSNDYNLNYREFPKMLLFETPLRTVPSTHHNPHQREQPTINSFPFKHLNRLTWSGPRAEGIALIDARAPYFYILSTYRRHEAYITSVPASSYDNTWLSVITFSQERLHTSRDTRFTRCYRPRPVVYPEWQ